MTMFMFVFMAVFAPVFLLFRCILEFRAGDCAADRAEDAVAHLVACEAAHGAAGEGAH